jgi:hypothetical protein
VVQSGNSRVALQVPPAHGAGVGAEMEAAPVEHSVDRPGERPPVCANGRHYEQAHSLQPVGYLPGGHTPAAGVDAAQMSSSCRVAAVQQSLQTRQVRFGLVHACAPSGPHHPRTARSGRRSPDCHVRQG